jgi:hypothetical protein
MYGSDSHNASDPGNERDIISQLRREIQTAKREKDDAVFRLEQVGVGEQYSIVFKRLAISGEYRARKLSCRQ